MSMPHLSLMDARHLQLAAQWLLTPRLQYGAIPPPAGPVARSRRHLMDVIDTAHRN
ncbi:hypothetical protein [Aeromonas sp. 1HA1]|uniref:hypothetical protein n=1 Tax=Aeromonas sp. 1HA1 TaxID=2699193 RepID=UPI0023DDA903|nr:hypothetical protein [Aeromonas sp. 1HA1]MDF2413423.1 hypothetical protein [Aeromonas sp. 1HA1]